MATLHRQIMEAEHLHMARLAHLMRDNPNYDRLSEVVAMVATVYFRLGRHNESIHAWKRVLHAPPKHMKAYGVEKGVGGQSASTFAMEQEL